MMKHFVFLLYLLSYTTGIGTITLLSLYYLRTKLAALKYFALFTLFFTLSLIFDTLNYYFQIVVDQNSEWVQLLILSGMYFAATGMVCYMGIAVYSVLHRKFRGTVKTGLWGSALFIFSNLSFFYVSYRYSIFPGFTAFHTGYTIINIYTIAGVGYFLYLLINNFKKLGLKSNGAGITFLSILLLLMPASVFANLVSYMVPFKYPIAFSPLIYFLSNFTLIFFIAGNHLHEMPVADIDPGVSKNERVIISQAIINKYNVTDRELEILQLILDGYGNREIGEKLFISANTARNHIYNIFRKFEVKSRYELIRIFYS
jgi:DNA-binding CsgD family transcriptional regulator